MRARTKIPIASVVFALCGVGCAADLAEPTPVEAAVITSPLKRAECSAQRERCAADTATPSGKVGCRVQYASCLQMAEDGAPQPVVMAAAQAAACARTELDCANAAPGDKERAACVDAEAQCVAALIGAKLPQVSLANSACVEQALDCIDRAQASEQLPSCGGNLQSCADAVALAAMPPAVSQAVGEVSECRNALDACVIAAKKPEEIPACSEQESRCVAQGLQVPVPDNVPPGNLIDCAAVAVVCTLAATNLDSLDSCTRAFDRCVVGDARQPLTCAERWTQCVADQPLLLPICSLELLGCQDP